LRVKGLIERRKDQHVGEYNLPIVSEEFSDSKLSYAEKYLEEKKRLTEEKHKTRQQIHNDRAQRAQRRLEAKP
jgi:hypothetical protein